MSDGLKRAGESVERRGFLTGPTRSAFYDSVLMSQIGRLQEEIGEFARSMRAEDGPSITELADIVIVCAAIAQYLEWDLDMAVEFKCKIDEEKRGFRHGEPVHVDSKTLINGDG